MKAGQIFILSLAIITGITCFHNLANAAPYAYIPGSYDSNYGILVIDTATHTIIGNITVGQNPVGIAINPMGTMVYVTNVGSNDVSVIDTAANMVIATIKAGDDPCGITISPTGTRVYVVNQASVSVIDTATNTVIATINVEAAPNNIVVNPSGTRVYVTHNTPFHQLIGHNVTVIDTTTNNVINSIAVEKSPWGIAINPAGTRLYVTNYNSKSPNYIPVNVTVIDTATNKVIDTIHVYNDSNLCDAVINPAGTRLYVAGNSNHVYAIDTVTYEVIATIDVGNAPAGINNYIQGFAMSPDGTKVYVLCHDSRDWTIGTIFIIDTGANKVTETINSIKCGIVEGQFIAPIITPLDIVVNPVNVTVGTPTNVTFNVTSNGFAIDGAIVSLGGNASGIDITNATGIAIINVNSTAMGPILVTANMIGHTNGTANLTAYAPPVTLTPTPELDGLFTSNGLIVMGIFGLVAILCAVTKSNKN